MSQLIMLILVFGVFFLLYRGIIKIIREIKKK